MKRDLTEEQLRQEVTVTLPLSAVLRLAENDHEIAFAKALLQPAADLPAIGAPYQGGIFAGVTLDGDQRAALVLLPGDFNGTWADAKDWADKEDGVLPSRIDQLVLFKNVKSEFKEAWYWSSEPYEHDSGYAWYQSFYHGGQDANGVSDTDRARAVRRIPIR